MKEGLGLSFRWSSKTQRKSAPKSHHRVLSMSTITSSTTVTTGARNSSIDEIRTTVTEQPPEPATTDEVPAEPEDILDITTTETGTTTGTTTASSPQIYSPPQMSDKFRYNIEQGMFDQSLRYNAIAARYQDIATETHEARQSIEGQISRFSGSNSGVAALFALGYQNAQPNPNNATTHVEARVEQNRRIDSGLDLLNML